jgi:hypothetical protein
MRRADLLSPCAASPTPPQQYAETAPLDLIDGKRLVKALNQSRKHVLMPQTYKAMCCQCGEIVQHRLDREQDEARPCGNGHLVRGLSSSGTETLIGHGWTYGKAS